MHANTHAHIPTETNMNKTTEEMWTRWVYWVNILVVILYCIFQAVINGVNRQKGHGSLCIISYNCVGICNYLKIKSLKNYGFYSFCIISYNCIWICNYLQIKSLKNDGFYLISVHLSSHQFYRELVHKNRNKKIKTKRMISFNKYLQCWGYSSKQGRRNCLSPVILGFWWVGDNQKNFLKNHKPW